MHEAKALLICKVHEGKSLAIYMRSSHAGIDVMLIYTHMHAHVLEQIHMVANTKITKIIKKIIRNN